MNGQAGKGDGGMTFVQFEKRYKQLVKEGKITRSGRKIGETHI